MGCASSAAVTLSDIQPAAPKDFDSKYLLGKCVGRGSFAQVYTASAIGKRRSFGTVAVKVRSARVSNCYMERDECLLKSVNNEVYVWRQIGNHTNCVHLLESFFDDATCCMVMEKCSCELLEHINCLKNVTEESLAHIFTQMLQGISHVHSCNVVHRDVKPENFLLGGSDGVTVKLADFGLSAIVPRNGKLEGVSGSPPYMCPEMLENRKCDFKADVWSFGVVAYLLLCGELPYKAADGTSSGMKTAIVNGCAAKCDKPWLSDRTVLLLKCALDRNPGTRPSATTALRMVRNVISNYQRQLEDLRPMVRAACKSCRADYHGRPSNIPVKGAISKSILFSDRELVVPVAKERNDEKGSNKLLTVKTSQKVERIRLPNCNCSEQEGSFSTTCELQSTMSSAVSSEKEDAGRIVF